MYGFHMCHSVLQFYKQYVTKVTNCFDLSFIVDVCQTYFSYGCLIKWIDRFNFWVVNNLLISPCFLCWDICYGVIGLQIYSVLIVIVQAHR